MVKEYPVRIYASVLVYNGSVIDYKIGRTFWKDKYSVTLRGQITLEELSESEVFSTYWDVKTDDEYEEVFNVAAMDWVEQMCKLVMC